MRLGGDDHHQVRRGTVGTVGAADLPVGEVGGLHEHRGAWFGHVEEDVIVATVDRRHLDLVDGLLLDVGSVDVDPLPGVQSVGRQEHP